MRPAFIQSRKRGMALFISVRFESPDAKRMIGIIGRNIGADVRYIRFNGTVVGGPAGLRHEMVALK